MAHVIAKTTPAKDMVVLAIHLLTSHPACPDYTAKRGYLF
jgi:D-alanyl-D-alanine carboxypeptidase